jgi:hypothetical protein
MASGTPYRFRQARTRAFGTGCCPALDQETTDDQRVIMWGKSGVTASTERRQETTTGRGSKMKDLQ